MNDSATHNAHSPLSRALLRLLKPLVKLLLRHGVPFAAFAELAKRAYVDVAGRDFALPGRKQTDSRIATITGLTRKEVARLKAMPATNADPALLERYHRAGRVVYGWVHDAAYSSPTGEAAALNFDGEAPSFTTLAKRYSGDMPPRAILDELLHVGVVELRADGKLCLTARAYIPHASEAEKLRILGQDAAGLLRTIDRNIHEDALPRFFQRKVYYDNLPAEALPVLQALLNDRGQDLLEFIDQWMAAHDRDVNPQVTGTGRKAAGIGLYYFEDDGKIEET